MAMREANWDEIFQRRDYAPDDEGAKSPLPWEDWLTFAIVAIVFMSVVHSVDSAHWVDEMPSLYPLGFAALIAGYALSKVRLPAMLLHLIALLTGGALIYGQLLLIVPGATPIARTDAILDRMYAWWSALTQNGISTDPLPFIVVTLVLLWLGSYISAWAIFRWRNPWLGLVPGGTALMWNISFIPGQFSYAFVVYIFGAVMLLMRVHLSHKEEEWRRGDVAYPEFLSLSVLNATFWMTVVLLIAVWIVPLAERSNSANERWSNFTAPLTERAAPLGRVFVSVNAKKPIDVHNLEGALALQGKISLSDQQAVDLNVEITPEMARFLRAQSFDQYTSAGWNLNVEGQARLTPGERIEPADPVAEGARKDVTINVTVKGNDDQQLFSLGQPVEASRGSRASLGDDPADVASLEPARRLRDGDTYSSTGSVVTASIQQLQAAGDDYPAWVTDRYLGLPSSLPDRVGDKAAEVTRNADTPFDRAAAIERYLRTFPNDFKVPSTPSGRDTVDYFLFDLQRGYFDYHASAMAVMLRTQGVPARVASGYVVDPLQRQGDSNGYALTEKQAFAWPEVYFPGVGWVEFSPTPSQPLILRPGTAPNAPPATDTGGDPNIRPDEPDLGISPRPSTEPAAPVGSGDGASAWPAIITLAAIGGVGLALAGGGRLAWEFGMGGLSRPAQMWEKTQRLARLGKAGARPQETPREFAARLSAAVPGTGGARSIASAYERVQFGQKSVDEDEAERLETAWVAVRNALLRRILRLRPKP